ncbi:MAG: histidinol-phosphate aminotransferase family protein [Butyrivibrio sp.]|nr:histidinol-phosphate aminotransferase family protein [Muribaculum sp.]MCM1551247.1 histidinol-phosphate aminotransferase family protein [Butyrivibrio sp.]
MEVNKLLCKNMKEKPETRRASRKLTIDINKLVRMGLNENAFGTSPKAIQAMKDMTEYGNYYQDWTQSDIKSAISEYYDVPKEFIVTGCGSSALTDALGTAFLESGDEVLLAMPTFPAIIDTAQINGATPVIVPMDEEELRYDMDKLYDAITDKTKMVYICNPNNPTGTYVGIKKLIEFARKCPDHVIQVYDEAYIEFAEAEDCIEMVGAMKEFKDKPIVVLKTFSKFFGMAGVRAGFVLAQPEIIEWLSKCGTQFALSKISQAGAAAAMRDVEHAKYVKTEVAKWRTYLSEELIKLGCKVYPSQTNFIFFDPHVDPMEVNNMMADKGIMMSAQAGACRVSVGTPEQNRQYVEYLSQILDTLRSS